jgi:hypothetical protein
VPAEEAVANLESPRVVFAAIHKHDHAVFADVVPAGQGVLRSPGHTAETSAVAHNVGPPALKLREIACMDAGCRSTCNELLKETR